MWRIFALGVVCYVLADAAKGNGVVTQEDLDYIARTLEIRVKVVDNLEHDGAKHLFHVTLYNPGSNLIQGSNWTIYFYSFFMIESDHLPKDGGFVLESQNIRLNHIQGMLFSLEPVSGFGNINSKEIKSLYFHGQNWAVSKTDIPPNWYITSPGLQPRVFKSTSPDNPNFVSNFVLPKQWKRYKSDVYDPYTPEVRYNKYHMTDLGKVGKYIIPTPESITVDESSHVTLDPYTWRIRAESEFINEANYLADKSGLQSEENPYKNIRPKTISLLKNIKLANEEYYLAVKPTEDHVVIIASTKSGMFYGVQSLLSLIDGSKNRKLPKTEVRDKPRFEFRGMHFDVARNFHNKETVMKLLDVMAMYKMNKLHFHLTDDEGWRLEIAGLPELTSIASQRCHDLKDETCLISQLGSGPDNSTSGSGFYTRHEYIEIVKYANSRHIEIIPEIDTPGHARAAIKAMEARFRRLRDAGHPNADEYRLIDPNDTSVYSSVQMFTDNAVNPCIESTYNFISAVIDDLKVMHTAAGQPLKVYHFGGDEVANGAWENSTACNALNFNSALTGREKYKLYFVLRVAKITNQKGLKLGGWEDGLMDAKNPYALNMLATSEVIANPWDNVWEWGVAKRAYAFANSGYKLVLSHATHLYFDHPYEPDPEERGLYWATRFTDTFKTFGYNAVDLYKNIDVKRSGEPIAKAEVCTKDNSGCPPLNKPENVKGMQGHLWSETMLTKENLEYMVFPRMLSLAERAWHKAPWETVEDDHTRKSQIRKDWELFANSVGYKEIKRLENMGVNFRLAPPGAKLINNKVMVNTEFPAMQVEYSSDNGMTWRSIPERYEPHGNFLLRSKSPNGLRSSRVIKFTLHHQKIEFHKVDRCKNDRNCKDGLVCLNFWCTPIQCKGDRDCRSPKLACFRGRCMNRKRKCNSDMQCGQGYICEEGFCVFRKCWRDQDCGSGNRCDRGRCVNKPRCKDDRHCGKGRICEDSFCIQRQCYQNEDCLKQNSCNRGKCLADCTPCFFRDPKSKSNDCIYKCTLANEYCSKGKCLCNHGYHRNKKQQCKLRLPQHQ